MALCVEIIGNTLQVLTPQPANVSACAYILQSGVEYLSPWVQLFEVPTSAELATAFSIGVVIPLTGYAVASAIQPIVNFFKE